MATLVLSTVGTILGGPIGGALGSLVGQAIDQSLFGPPTRRGPRLGDLRVQTSSYGTPIPRIYGTMRVAGTVVWAADLKEEEVASGGGKGSPGTISYTYSASFAVALSSRAAASIGRIWADGKLLRGANGSLKTKGKLRFYTGSESQTVDPLIAAIEGSGGSTAFRGLALAVFEDLALADYANRIPSLTFELKADATPPRVAAVIADIAGGMIEDGLAPATLIGFAALGNDRRSAVEPLVELWGGTYHDDGARVRARPESEPSMLLDDANLFGCTTEGNPMSAMVERRQEPADALPTVLTVDYYDPARDYQAGQMRASLASGGRSQRRIDSAAALSAEVAKSLASDALARRWAGRDRMTLRLAPTYCTLRPGELIEVPPVPGLYRIEQVVIDALVVIIDARRTHLPGGVLIADPGRPNSDPDVTIGASVPVLLDLPAIQVAGGDAFGLFLALGCTGAFKPTVVELSANGAALARLTVERAAITGVATNLIEAGEAQLIDRIRSVEVVLSNTLARLFHADTDALAMGANAAILGAEVIQFARADAIGPGQYRLSGLLRGRRASEWAMAAHLIGERFVLLEPATIAFVALDPAMLGASIEARAYGVADDEADPPLATRIANGEGQRPLAPCHLRGSLDSNGLWLNWVPRRVGSLGWVSGEDPDTSMARFAATISRPDASVVREVTGTTLHLEIAELTALGSGDIAISLVEVAVGGTSRPVTLNLDA